MKIVITGGNGYLGARLCRHLADEGHDIIPVCFPAIPEKEEWVSRMFTVLMNDLTQDKVLTEIRDINPDAIIHLVSLDHFNSEKDARLVCDINVLTTWRLLDLCTKNGLKKFIYFSTVQVYGKLPLSDIDEMQAVNTGNIYGLTHYLSENICDHFNRNTATNVISVRLSNSYGDPLFHENNCWWLVINDLCKSAFINKEIRLLSDGSPQRDFIHGNDVSRAIDILINTEIKLSDNIYHISSGSTLTLIEIALVIKNEYQLRYGKSLPIITNKGLYNEVNTDKQAEKYTISNAKIKTLGFIATYSLSRGVNELFNYLETNYAEQPH